jgi:TetR/AcrR family transcriptional regulator
MSAAKNKLSAEERREVILEAALEVFARHGYSGARTKEIARKAGVSETLVFKHFKNKKALYKSAQDHLFGHHPVYDELEPAMTAGDDRQVLYLLALHIIGHSRRDERIVRLTLYSGLEGGELARHEDSVVQMLEDYLAKRMETGALMRTNPALTARYFLYSAFIYAGDTHLKIASPPTAVSDEEAAKVLADIFMQGLKT